MATERQDVPTQAGASLGSTGVNVEAAQNHLEKYGYVKNGVHARFGMTSSGAAPPPAKKGVFDEATEEALRKYQRFHGLEVTGVVDQSVIEEMAKERCGLPDIGSFQQREGRAGAAEVRLGKYVLQGGKWDQTHLRYGFQEFTSDLSQVEIRNAISRAINYWAAVTPLSFSEIPIGNDPEIRIRFVTGAHGDGAAFDGAGGVLAHAFYPEQGDISGDSHFDDAETWSDDLPPSGIDLETVAAHEFGHALGLAHSSVNDALMFPTYSGAHRYLHQDDIDGIQALYGVEQWHTSKLCLRVFATYHAKNAWCYLEDVGWRKIRPKHPDGVNNMLYAACEGRAKGMPLTALATDSELLRLYV